MKRKLIKQGGGGCTIYLPKKWLTSQGLEWGMSVSIEEKDSFLLVSSESLPKKHADIDVTGNPDPFIKTKIMNLYRMGYDSLTVTYGSLKEQKNVMETMKSSLGFAIVSDNGKVMEIESITEPAMNKYETLVLRLFYIFNETFDNITDHKTVRRLVRDAYKYDNFCRRALSKRILREERTPIIWAFHLQIIHAFRNVNFLSEHLDGKKIPPRIKELLEVATETIDDLRNAYVKKDISLLLHIYKKRNYLFEDGHDYLQSKDGAVAHHLINIINDVYLAASPLYSILSDQRGSLDDA